MNKKIIFLESFFSRIFFLLFHFGDPLDPPPLPPIHAINPLCPVDGHFVTIIFIVCITVYVQLIVTRMLSLRSLKQKPTEAETGSMYSKHNIICQMYSDICMNQTRLPWQVSFSFHRD